MTTSAHPSPDPDLAARAAEVFAAFRSAAEILERNGGTDMFRDAAAQADIPTAQAWYGLLDDLDHEVGYMAGVSERRARQGRAKQTRRANTGHRTLEGA